MVFARSCSRCVLGLPYFARSVLVFVRSRGQPPLAPNESKLSYPPQAETVPRLRDNIDNVFHKFKPVVAPASACSDWLDLDDKQHHHKQAERHSEQKQTALDDHATSSRRAK